MANRIILRHKPSGDWVVKVKGKGERDIKLGQIPSNFNPDVTTTTLEVVVRKHNVSSDYFILLCGIWYQIPPQLHQQSDFKIKTRKIPDGWKAKVKNMSVPTNPPWIVVDDQANIVPEPKPEETDDLVEVHFENPRWVKVGTRWYYIG